MTVYEQELRKLFEHSDLVDRPQFSGRVCVGDLGKDLRVRAEFLSTHISSQYDAIRLMVLNRTEGVVDRTLLRFQDVWGKKQVPNNPNFRSGVIPHLWDDYGKVEWYIRSGYHGAVPTLQDFHAELLRQPEKEAQDVALAIELFTDGSLNTFAKPTNVDTNARILCYDIRDLGKQLLPVGMLVVLDSIFNRIIRNRGLKRNTWIYIDEIYLLFQHEYSANFLFTLWKRMRKYQACGTGISQNIEDLLQSHTARTMLANSEFLIMLNQAATDREELARLLNISDNQLSYITNVDSGRGLIKCGSAIVPFVDSFPRHTRLYQMMTTRPSDLIA